MTVDIENLTSAALAATKGKWCTDGARQVVAAESDQPNSGFVIVDCQGPDNLKNAAFIAAADPVSVLWLLAEFAGYKTGYEAYERVNAELRAECEALRKIISESATACGAAVSVDCSLEFMAMLPAEIGSVVGRLRKGADRYQFASKNFVDLGSWSDEHIDAAMSKEASHG